MIKRTVLIFLSLAFIGQLWAEEPDDETRLLRFPAVHENTVIFTYAGDLYRVDRDGGVARQLTSHQGYAMFPKFSENGEEIAFTAQYDGNREVYKMPAEGGKPERLTYSANLDRDYVWERMGPNNIVMDWKGDDSILYRSRWRHDNPWKGDLRVVDDEGGMPRTLPFSSAGFANFSPDGDQLAFNRVFREFRTWKHYRGGMADDIRIMDFETGEIQTITDDPGQDIIPMWHEDKIYFLSDRNWRMNLFAYEPETEGVEQVTDFQDYDIKFPSLGRDAIAFEKGGEIYVHDINSGETDQIPIKIRDDKQQKLTRRVDADEDINSHHLSPDGSRMLFSARGDVFSVPGKEGITYNLTRSEGNHNREVRWSPEGERVAFISDRTGEDEIYVMPTNGEEEPTQLTDGGDTYKYHLRWSPDGENILWGDRKLRLQYVNVNNQEVTHVDSSDEWEIRDFRWSPDGRWVVYSKPEREQERTIYTFDTENESSHPMTEGWYPSYRPHFSEDGQYLYFVSQRNFNPIYSNTEWNHAYRDMAQIYLIPLTKETPSPFKTRNDRVNLQRSQEDEENDESDDTEVRIDFENLTNRTEALPIKASNYGNLASHENRLFYRERSHADDRSTLKSFHFEEREESEHGHVGSFQLSDNGEKMLLSKQGDYFIIDPPNHEQKFKTEEKVSLDDMDMQVNLKEEWEQIFHESWRQMRDFFYAPNMHGFDWDSVRIQYEPFLEHVNHRADLTYIIGEMIGELNAGHAYVGGGDLPEVEDVKTGLLGGQFSKDEGSGFFSVDKVLEGANWREEIRSPLRRTGVNVKEGDYILSINGRSLEEVPNIYSLLVGKAGKTVELKVNDAPEKEGSRKVLVEPIANEHELYYHEQIQTNIHKVDTATDGQVGYVHIPDMGPTGLNKFVEYFFPQLRKDGLIVDVRGNGGGNVSPMLIERLRREQVFNQVARYGAPEPDPSDMLLGPKVTLMDQWSASDGDLFPYRFKKHDLGPVIGHRSWGGVVGIRGSLDFVDGGTMRKPEFAKYDTEGEEWIIEGHGVEPDIEVHNNPYREYHGHDNQLERAIEEVKERLEEEDHEIADPPPYPDKSRDGQ